MAIRGGDITPSPSLLHALLHHPSLFGAQHFLAEIAPAGQAWIEAFRKPSQRAMRAMFQGFTPEELVVFRDLCLRLATNQQRLADRLRQIGSQP